MSFNLTRALFRTAIVGGLAVGGLTLLVGPDRVMAGAAQIRQHVVCWFDSNVDDPTVLRQQLKQLQKEYPQKIGQVRSSLAEVDAEIAAIRRDQEVSTNFISITDNDLRTLKSLVEKAHYVQQSQTAGNATNAAATTIAGLSVAPQVLVSFKGQNITVDQAYSRAQAIKQSMVNYQDRIQANTHDLNLLSQQRDRLAHQLGQLESENQSFQSQIWQIERQISTIERNKSLISMMQDREDDMHSNDKWHVRSLDALQNRLAEIQKENDAILDSLSQQQLVRDYEREAEGRAALNSSGSTNDPFTIGTSAISPSATSRAFPVPPIVVDENTPAPPTHDKNAVGQTIASLPSGGSSSGAAVVNAPSAGSSVSDGN